MALSGPQSEQLQNAILNAFNQDDLVQMTLFDMDIDLFREIPKGPLAAVVFNLVSWCEDRGRLPDLLATIGKRRPRNTTFQKTIADLSQVLALPTPPPPPSAG